MKTNRTHAFIVHGDPLLLSRARIRGGRFCDASEELKIFWKSHLSKQFEGLCCFGKTPLSLDATFFFPFPMTMSFIKKMQYESSVFFGGPEMSKMIHFIQSVAQGLLYDSQTKIVKVTCCKRYSVNPRSCFTLTEGAY